jgi:hypothetical protein
MIKLENKEWAGQGARMGNFIRNTQNRDNLEDQDVDGRFFCIRVLEKYCVRMLFMYNCASSRDKFGQSNFNNWKSGRYHLFCDMKHCSSISPGFTENNHQRSELRSPVFVPRFKSWTFQILKLSSTLQIATYGLTLFLLRQANLQSSVMITALDLSSSHRCTVRRYACNFSEVWTLRMVH